MKSRMAITFCDSDRKEFDKLLRSWEDGQPRARDEIARIWVRPSLGAAGHGRTVAVPVEPELAEVLNAKHFPFTLEATGT
jgi:hypothetical protein